MILFAMESSCDEMAAAVVSAENGRFEVLSNIVSSQIAIHALYGGVVPEIASRAHCESVTAVAGEAVEKAGIPLSAVDAVAVTFAPGLIGSLLVGLSFAKSTAAALKVPLIPVDHIRGHVAAAYIEHEDVRPPFLALVVSGGHTSLYQVEDWTDFREIGCSRDDACGEAFDKVGRVMGLPYPGGAAMDRLAAEWTELEHNGAKNSYSFPSPAVSDESYDFSFSGLKTAVINTLHNEKQKRKTDDLPREVCREIAGAFTRTVSDGICRKLNAALRETGAETLVMAGGVAANSHLRAAIGETCRRRKVRFAVPSLPLCGDNAVMIAAAGYHSYLAGIEADSSLNAYASDEGSEACVAALLEIKARTGTV